MTEAASKALAEALYVLEQATSFLTKKARDGHAKAVADMRAALSPQPVAPEPVHWRAVLAPDEVPMQLNPSLHVLGFRSLKAAESRVASEEDFNGWHYTIEPLYATQPAPGAREPLSDERILCLWDAYVGYETGEISKRPLTAADKLQFARACIRASNGIHPKPEGV